MKLFLFVALAAVLSVGCSKGDNTASEPTAKAPAAGGSGTVPTQPAGPAPAGKYVAVQAIFTQSCVKCHSGGRPKAGIDLTNYDALMKGGTEGPVIMAGKPDTSKLVMALHGKGARQMPPKSALPAADIATVEAWIKDGAKNG